jgi:lysophospholipid acyltransferase (LPLAT)-like uncharacterized protein
VTGPAWQASRRKRLEVAAIAAVASPLIGLLARTFRWRVEGWAHYEEAAAGQPVIIAFWHGRILPGMCYFRDRGIVVITSLNFDGEWIARIIQRFGYGTARGSSSRNAGGALRQMIRDMRAGRSTAFTLDGPRGPGGVAKPGAIWLAMATGCPIVPFHIESDRHWALRSWDRTQIPKPFSRVALAVGEPITVPRDLDGEAVEARRLELEGVLARLRERSVDMLREERT